MRLTHSIAAEGCKQQAKFAVGVNLIDGLIDWSLQPPFPVQGSAPQEVDGCCFLSGGWRGQVGVAVRC